MLRFNRWFQDNAATTAPPMTLLDTSRLTPAESVARTAAWVREQLP
jgi:hypothetical protein